VSSARAARQDVHPWFAPAAVDLRVWLFWLARVRFVIITVLFSVVLVLQKYTALPAPARYFVPLVLIWYTLALFFGLLMRATLHSHAALVGAGAGDLRPANDHRGSLRYRRP